MAVKVNRDRDPTVAQALRHDLRMDARCQPQGRVGVPQVVEANALAKGDTWPSLGKFTEQARDGVVGKAFGFNI